MSDSIALWEIFLYLCLGIGLWFGIHACYYWYSRRETGRGSWLLPCCYPSWIVMRSELRGIANFTAPAVESPLPRSESFENVV